MQYGVKIVFSSEDSNIELGRKLLYDKEEARDLAFEALVVLLSGDSTTITKFTRGES